MGHRPNTIEQAVLTTLRDDPTLSQYVKAFELYDGQFAVEDVMQFKGELPACFVTYAGDRFVEVSPNQTYMVKMGVSVIVAAKNLRAGLESKTGTAGSQQMLEDVKTLLHKNDLALAGVVGMVLLRRVPLIVDKNLSIFGMDFEIEFVN